jgi:UDP-glucuronate 4-epimerase
MKKKNILITGAAGFIGFSLCKKLLKNKNNNIIGIDNLNSYYSIKLKKNRLNILKKKNNFIFLKIDLIDQKKLKSIFNKYKFDKVYNFAAQAGVRYSYINPQSYCNSNIIGFNNVLKFVKEYNIPEFYFASSSSVYGDSKPYPKKEKSKLYPSNIYSLSKLSNEIISETFSRSMKTKIIGLRFFSIYGEWGRPDMMILKYLLASKFNKSFELFNYGNHYRDFTYIDDAINIVCKIDPKKLRSNFEIFNICSSKPIKITKILDIMNNFNIKAKVLQKPLHTADVLKTYGDNKKILDHVKSFKFTDYKVAVKNTVKWFIFNSKLFN